MGMFVHPPFALFSLVDVPIDVRISPSSAPALFAHNETTAKSHIPHQTLNSILEEAHEGSTVEAWYFYLAVHDYASAPRTLPDGTRPDGTEAPISSTFQSDFIDKSVEDVANWLRNKPEDVRLETKFFAVLDKKATQGKVVLCRIADDKEKPTEPSCVLRGADQSSLTLVGMEAGTWGELVHDVGEYTPDL